jgi:glycosyltransferase involved in cell wall biosynthesis
MDEKGVNLSVVVPLYNEQGSLEKLVTKIHEETSRIESAFEIILIDDGSTDGTWKGIERLKETFPTLRGIRFRRNFGQTAAMVAGFEHARGRVIITMDGDLQNDPADIPLLLAKMEEGYDIVSGWRKDRKDDRSRVLPSKVANYIISKTTGVHLNDYGCSLKAYRRDCIKYIKAYGEMHRFFPALATMTGARVAEIPVNHRPRKYGVSKYGFDRIFKVASDVFAINLIIRFSSMPLKGFTLLAAPFSALTFFFATLAISASLMEWSAGKASFFAILAGLNLIAVVVLICLGILSELVVGYSDLTHTELPEINKSFVPIGPRVDKNVR